MIKKYLIISLLCSFLGFSQFNSSAPWMKSITSQKEGLPSLDEQVDAFTNYWTTHDKNKKGSGFKPFMRSEYHWRNFSDDQGYVISSAAFWEAWRQKKQAHSNKFAQSLPVSNWQAVGPFTHTNTGSWSSGQGRVNIVHVDPSNSTTIYLGAPAGGIWKSTDNGVTWAPLTDNLPQIGVSGIAVDYSDSNVLYIATGDKDAGDSYSVGVFKSTDGGLTWNATGTMGGANPTRAGDVVIHPTNNQILWCATNNGIYKSSNAGNSWTQVQTGNFSQGSLRLKPGDPNTVYAVSNNRFYRSTNMGDAFTQIISGLPLNSGRLILDVTPANDAYVYILSANSAGDMQGIYRSINEGSNWTKTSSNEASTGDVFESSQSWYDLAFAVSTTDANEIYTGCLNIWKSTDGGATVTKMNNWSSPTAPSYTHADIHYLGFHGTKLFAGTDGGIYVSSNGGINFTDLTAGAQISQFYKIAVSKQSAANMVGGLQDNGGHAYSSGQWKNYYGADGMDTAIDPTNPNLYYGFIQSGGSLYISSNAGNSLSGSVGAPPGSSGNWVTPLVSNSVGTIFSGFDNLFKLTNGAWVQQNTTPIGSGNLELISIDPSNNNIIYISNGSNLYKSTDEGITFTNVYNAPNTITSIEVHSSLSSTVYITTAGASGQVRKSTDGGLNFVDISSGLPSIGKNCIVHQGRNTDNPLYVGTSLGVYYRDDTMSSWQPFDLNLPNVSVTDLELNVEDAKLVAATYGRGIWQTDIPVQVPPIDLKLVTIQSPSIDINCSATITPQVEVKNSGLNTINTVIVDYTIDGTPYNFIWNGTLATNINTTINLPPATLLRGVHTIAVTTTTANDAYSDNNSGAATFYINDAGIAGAVNPFTTPSDALISYNEGSAGSQWVRGIRTGIMTSSGNTVYTTNLTNNYPDMTKSYIVSQCYDLSVVSNPQISFAMKYDLEENWDVVYVQYSTDFGANWSLLGAMGSSWYTSDRTPATAGNDCYNCPGGQWTGSNLSLTTYSYPLTALNSETNIIFRIVFHSDESVNQRGVNIDDFVISGTLSAPDFEQDTVVIYPNPSNGIFNISFGTVVPKALEVYDVSGKMIASQREFQSAAMETLVDLSHAAQGIYFVKIAGQNQTIVKRIIKM